MSFKELRILYPAELIIKPQSLSLPPSFLFLSLSLCFWKTFFTTQLLCWTLREFLQTATPAKKQQDIVRCGFNQNNFPLKFDWHCPCLVNTVLTAYGVLHCVVPSFPVKQMVFKHQSEHIAFQRQIPLATQCMLHSLPSLLSLHWDIHIHNIFKLQ